MFPATATGRGVSVDDVPVLTAGPWEDRPSATGHFHDGRWKARAFFHEGAEERGVLPNLAVEEPRRPAEIGTEEVEEPVR